MCLVEITSGRRMDMPILEWDAKKGEYVHATKPKLQPACQMGAADGMEVSTKNENVKQAQAAVQEFLLLNHPVDCPICDQAGECKLQDYWLEHGKDLKRKRTEPVHKVKGVRFGPTIVYDGERCVMCTRCIRVCDELVGDSVLDMRERGNKNEIFVAPGRELDHDYTLMTEHVCPVGALTSRDFRFKARVWFLKSAPGICSGCARGCNSHVDFDPRYNQVYRLRPRDNEDVNKYWMCDDGMMTYKEVHEDRVLVGSIGRGDDAEELGVREAIAEAAAHLRRVPGERIAVVLSAGESSENNLVAARFAKDVLGTEHLYLAARPKWKGDDILRHEDHNPNRKGAELAAGVALKSEDDLVTDVASGRVAGVLVLGSNTSKSVADLAALTRLDVVSLTASHGPYDTIASVVVPVASWAEQHGTFVNADGLAQTFKRAIPAPGRIAPAWQTLVAIAAELGAELAFGKINDVRAALSAGSAEAGSQEARA
jgi:NADH-quinone oxidoreductase subunit G